MDGNPRERRSMPGEAVVTPTAKNLIKQDADESVGYIEINVPDNEGGIISYSDGTGFRVGDTYMMSAFHVFEGLVGHLIEKIVYKLSCVPDKDKDELEKKMKEKLRTENMEELVLWDFNTRMEGILRRFLDCNANDTKLLLRNLNGIIDTGLSEELERQNADIWKHNCKVNFIRHGQFHLDWKIVFGDKNLDIIIVNLLPSKQNHIYPKAFILDEKYRQHGDIQIIRYLHRDPRVIIIDQECDVFQDDETLRRSVNDAIDWWTTSNFPDKDESYFRAQYDACNTAVDSDTGRVILKSSESFIQGSSGSPVTYLLNKEDIAIVEMIYQGGFPPFYYEPHLPNCFRNKAVPGICFFGRGTTMQKLSQVLDVFGKMELKRQLFTCQSVRESRQNVVPDLDGNGAETDDPTQRSADKGESHLHEVTRKGHIKIANVFLSKGAPVNKVNNKGESVLHYVVYYLSEHKTELAKKLLAANNALVNVVNKEHESLLHYTARFESQRNVELAKLFTEKGAHVYCKNKQGESLLHYTTRYAREYGIQLAKLFLQNEAPVDIRNKDGESILHYTARYSNRHSYDLATMFIRNRAPKTENNDKESLLHYTVRYQALNKKELAVLFVEYGVSVHCCNNRGQSLLDYVTSYLTDDDEQLIDFFFSKGIKFEKQD